MRALAVLGLLAVGALAGVVVGSVIERYLLGPWASA
jgi:hypothetical protein